MKPPKSIRNLVNSLLGKKSKSSIKASESFDSTSTSLDKSGRHHRSVDDILEDNSKDLNSNCISNVNLNHRSKSLPRRSQSCLNVSPSTSYPSEPIYGRRVLNGLDNYQKFEYEREPSRRSQFISNQNRNNIDTRTRSSTSLPRTQSSRSGSNSTSRNDVLRRNSPQHLSHNESDEGYHDSMQRTSSWSHPNSENKRSSSFDSSINTQNPSNFSYNQGRPESAGPIRNNSRIRSRFSSHEDLLDSQQMQRVPSAASSRTITSSKDATEEKLRTCLQVLDRLSAQVKEIKDVSKRVNYVDNKVKNRTMQGSERERRIHELNMADATSRRLKNMIKSNNTEEGSSTRLSSRSSGYESESSNSSRRSSSSPQQLELQRSSRPTGKRATHLQVPGVNHRGHNMSYHHQSHAYPQSLSDVLPIWDAEEAGLGHKNRRPTREDSMSSGYATGSDDGRHNSPNVTDADSAISGYSMQGRNLQYQQKPISSQHWNPQHYHQQQHQMAQYNQETYNPYAIYGSFQQPTSNATPQDQEIYGTYGELYDYAPSSVYEQEIYSNGWYQLPAQPSQAPTNVHYADPNQVHAIPVAEDEFNQGWSQMTSVSQNAPVQHGGLSDLFYDPTTQSNTTMIENIAKEVAMGEENQEESTWKTYGSFRYRNGQRTVTTTGMTNRKRKTVRFSQTVKQRIETDESEMEDSTSVIKGGSDEHENHTQSVSENTAESNDTADSSEIYMWPRQHPVQAINISQSQTTDQQQQQQKTLPEPIYEFPSGHIESSCMCSDCILARGSCQMQPAQVVSYY